jgi:tetratricopeptide (TPR) repeat protein
MLVDILKPNKNYELALGSVQKNTPASINILQWILIILTIIIAGNYILSLFRYWYADTIYALGYNLDRSYSFQQAFPLLQNAVKIEPNEPVYKDELAVNLATLAQIFYLQKDASTGAQLANEAINIDNQIITEHPNNIVYWKNRLRIFYSLASGNQQNQAAYFTEALKAINKSSELAPTDARVWLNLGILVGQTNSLEKGVKILKKTIELKPDYQDAYHTLGEFYHQLALGETIATTSATTQKEKIVNPQMQQKAEQTMEYILKNLSPNDDQAKKALKDWNAK